jgi:hypothetical protein
MLFGANSAHAFSLNLDSISEMGRFPKFCIDTYRWADKFFNGYDTLYVRGTGYKFNAKIKTESWTDYYAIDFINKTHMNMTSRPSTSAGLYLSYLAVSLGYDINFSKYFNGGERARKRFDFQFNCMLLAAQLYYINNDVGTRITGFAPEGQQSYNPKLHFDGINTTQFGADVSYFINHKRYSQSAAFNYGRVQIKSGGSFYVGLSYWRQKYNFDFSGLPEDMTMYLPSDGDYHYQINTHNYFVKGGYGYNWVFSRHWMLGVSESPMLGVTHGYISTVDNSGNTFALLNDLRLAVVFNNKQWFSGMTLGGRVGVVGNRKRALTTAILTMEISAGMRFNLW